jgi:hypothetical protein
MAIKTHQKNAINHGFIEQASALHRQVARGQGAAVAI